MTIANILQRKARPIRREAAMHLFTVGQAVRLRSGFRAPCRFAGIYHVTGMLPPVRGTPQYRIRSDDERHERVTTQDSLEAVSMSRASVSATLIERTFGPGHGKETQESRDQKAEAG